jgi:hypothetical protein
MLIVPASKTSVPLAVVIRTRSNTPLNVIPPPPKEDIDVVVVNVMVETQEFPDTFEIVIAPKPVSPASAFPQSKPVVLELVKAEPPFMPERLEK